MFNFVSENEEGDYEGSVMSFEDIDYPLPDEYLSEIIMCAMKFPNSMKLLLYPNVWIDDTGATVNASPNASVMVKKVTEMAMIASPWEMGKVKPLSGMVICL
jgi:hypothetical protein